MMASAKMVLVDRFCSFFNSRSCSRWAFRASAVWSRMRSCSDAGPRYSEPRNGEADSSDEGQVTSVRWPAVCAVYLFAFHGFAPLPPAYAAWLYACHPLRGLRIKSRKPKLILVVSDGVVSAEGVFVVLH